MSFLDPEAIRRAKLIAPLLDSDNEGEATAALLALKRMGVQQGVPLGEVLALAAAEPAEYEPSADREWRGNWWHTPPADYVTGLYKAHQISARDLLKHGGPWNEIEADFFQRIAMTCGKLSDGDWLRLSQMEGLIG